MIIFDLDGTLANCEHRRHFVDPSYDMEFLKSGSHNGDYASVLTNKRFKPNWPAFYEACDRDSPIEPMLNIFRLISHQYDVVEIWSGRSEGVRATTIDWLIKHTKAGIDEVEYFHSILKMRPIGDNTPDDQLKEKWLDETITEGKTVDMVFDDRAKVVKMWQRRGIFVFDVSQGKGEF
jgi:hypothetical protein